MKFETSKGDFVVQINKEWAPLGAERFFQLVQSGFYDQARFFRVLPGFMVQFGINADPKTSALWQNMRIPDDPVKQSNTRGRLTFAMGGPGTRTTQVFINYADNSRLDASGFAPLGEVVSGMDVVDRIYSGYGEGYPGGNGPRQDLMQTQGQRLPGAEFPASRLHQEGVAAVTRRLTSSFAPPFWPDWLRSGPAARSRNR